MRFPLFALIAPILTSLILWAVTGSPLSLLFGLLGPVMAVAQFADSRRHSKKTTAEQEIKAQQEEQERRAVEQATDLEHRQELLFRFPPASQWAHNGENLRPHWSTNYRESSTKEKDRVIRVGINLATGLPELVDITAGVALIGPDVETCSLQRALATQLSWRNGIEEYAVSGLSEPEVPRFSSLNGPLIHRCSSQADIPPGVRFVCETDNGKGRLLDLLGVTPTTGQIQWDLLTRAEHNLILDKYGQYSAATAQEDLPHEVILVTADPKDSADARAGFPVIVGKGTAGSIVLDLVEHGPHALVVGRTGTGKTEFLKTWIIAASACYRPESLNFLIVDYKGGTGLHHLSSLPHVTGVASDLDHQQSLRILSSLSAEIRYRERILRNAEVSDISLLPQEIILARLVIVVDEYRSVMEHEPELGRLFADIASRGRSLGMHLILATQRVNSTVADAICANAPLRICFKVSEAHESQFLVGVPDAATIASVPGRAMVATAQSSAREFQASFLTEADSSRLLNEITSYFHDVEIRQSWCEPLPAYVDLSESPGAGNWLGIVDRPELQTRQWVTIPSQPNTVFLVSGPAASGKSSVAKLIASQTTAELISTAERLWDVVTAFDDSHSVVIDDIDVLLEEFSLEHREAFLAAFVMWVRTLRSDGKNLCVTLTTGSRYEMVWESLWQIRCTLTSAAAPGRGRLDTADIQVAFSSAQTQVQALTSDYLSDRDLPTTVVVVTSRTSLWRSWVAHTPDSEVLDPSAELCVQSPQKKTVWVGDTESWQENYRFFSQLKRSTSVLLDGVSAAEIRSLRVHSGLLPFVCAGKAILLDPESGPSRIDLNFLRRK